MMIQSPGDDGLPDLSEYWKTMQKRTAAGGKEVPPCTLGTGRASKKSHGGDDAAAARAAITNALGALSTTTAAPQLAHVTLALDVDSKSAVDAIRQALGDEVPIMGRTVAKKDNAGIIEVVVLHSAAGMGIQVGTMNVAAKPSDNDDPVAAVDAACREATRAATMSALTRLPPEYPPAFLIFAHSAGSREGVARQAITAAVASDVAYGGAAAGDADGYVLIAPGTDMYAAKSKDVSNQVAVVAAVPGEISFLLSSVVKNWTQPKFTEALGFMTPNYTNNPDVDLLTAIRYDDWEKFIYCIEKMRVDINHKWPNKQNQIPLLAACARLRIKMVQYLVDRGADVHHRNDGGFTAAMYTRMLSEHDRTVVEKQLAILEGAGANTTLDPTDEERLTRATNGRMVK